MSWISNLIRHQCFKNIDVRFLCSVKGLSANPQPDYLSNDFRKAQNSSMILDLVGQHHKIMNGQQVVQALRTLFTLQREGHSNYSTNNLIKHPNFEKLCTRLKWHVRFIELNEALDCLKVLSYVGIPSDSEIVQILLQIIRHSINDLSLKQIIFLDFLLNQFKRIPLVEGILIALPIVFEVNLSLKMDRNVSQLVQYLQYATQKHLNVVELLEQEILKALSIEQLDVKTANSIVWSLCDAKYHGPLLTKALDILIENFNQLSYNDMETVLYKLSWRHNPHEKLYYNSKFLNLCAAKVVDENLGLNKAFRVLTRILRFNHANNKLLDYVCVQLEENPEFYQEQRVPRLCKLAEALALTDYRPLNIQFLTQIIKETNFTEFKGINWPQLAASLCVLRIVKPEVLNTIFQDSFLNSILKKNIPIELENLLLVNQTIYSFYPNYIKLLPAQDQIDEMVRNIQPEDYPLDGALNKSLGGKEYILNGICTHLGQHIDHVFAIRKGGYPIAFSQEHIKYLEEVVIPPESEIIVILVLRSSDFTMNKRLKGSKSLTIEILENGGYNVVTVDLNAFNALQDREKIPYLMRSINDKTSILQTNIDQIIH